MVLDFNSFFNHISNKESIKLIEISKDIPRRIVSPPDIIQENKKTRPNYLSEVTSSADKESIKRGFGINSRMPFAEETRQTKRSDEQNTPPAMKNEIRGDDIYAVIKKLQSPKIDPAKANEQLDHTLNLVESGGIPDFLPEVEDGQITLLNTKASRYAVFVRRVGIRVFGQLRSLAWSRATFYEINKIVEPVLIEAKMDQHGEIISLSFKHRSGSKVFDELVKEAVLKGARDHNPPLSASVDGEHIVFIFKAKMWVKGGNNPMFQRRWLFLSIGLL